MNTIAEDSSACAVTGAVGATLVGATGAEAACTCNFTLSERALGEYWRLQGAAFS